MGDSSQGPEGGADKAPGGRQPYEKPAVAWEESLGMRPGLVVACNKVSGQDDFCNTGPGS